jgi:hypothetical protein
MDKTLETTVTFDQAKMEEVKAYQQGKLSLHWDGQKFVFVPVQPKVPGWKLYLEQQKRQQ